MIEWDSGMRRKYARNAIGGLLAMLLLSGCVFGPDKASHVPVPDGTQIVELKVIAPAQAKGILALLGFGDVSVLSDSHALVLGGSSRERRRACTVLDLIDTEDEYAVEQLVPVAEARSVPTNDQIAEVLGGISIGTFANSPEPGAKPRAIIDIHGESVVAIAPACFQREIVALVRFGPAALRQIRGEIQTPPPVAKKPSEVTEIPSLSESEPVAQAVSEREGAPQSPVIAEEAPPEILTAQVLPDPEPERSAESRVGLPDTVATGQETPVPIRKVTSRRDRQTPVGLAVPDEATSVRASAPAPSPEAESVETPIVVERPQEPVRPKKAVPTYELGPLANGDDVLELDLPDRLEVIQLLDLVAEYLNLDYMYDPEKIKGHSVSLRLHGKLQGEVKVKELYPLLESVLKFKGFAMTCHRDNLVTIVPVTDALQVDPALVDSDGAALGAGDMVVTRVFDLQYVNAASAMNVLEAMKLSVAASPIEETQTLIVTCYAHRMTRIERLLNMVDKPGRPKEFRYRQLKYTMAGKLAKKVEALAAELQTVPVEISPMGKPASPSVQTASASSRPSSGLNLKPSTAESSESAEKNTVYLDADERTNRILMIGHAEQLAIVDNVIDALDVAQHDPRTLRVYDVVHLTASGAEKKLGELDVIGKRDERAGATPAMFVSKTASSGGADSQAETGRTIAEETQVTVLEMTNSLLINATEEQHVRIETVLDHIDVAPTDLRILRVRDIRYVKADDVKKKLSEFGLIGKKKGDVSASSKATTGSSSVTKGEDVGTVESFLGQEPQVTVREATNSLLINATDEQYGRIEAVIELIDVVQQDLRTLKVYDMQHVDADEAKKKLDEFGLLGGKKEESSGPSSVITASQSSSPATSDTGEGMLPAVQDPQVAVLESTNSLLINATQFQHVQIASVIKHVDAEVRQEAIPYEIYFLENQEPETLAEVLGKLIQETVTSKDDKIQETVRRIEDDIVVVPDKGTFSLIVYASKKNQDWISKLIKALDKRRPQVLIDVTLVEIRKTDEFNYDLNLITSIPDLAETGGQTGSFLVDESTTVVDKLLQSGTRSQFADFQANGGAGTGFYADLHVNALLTAMQAKNYGRVLAKPKVLVNDNEKGTISTADTTYVETTSSIPVTSGAAGTESSLIETSVSYEAYDAGITLDITPHISEGQLLRLEISLKRSDFTSITEDKPPDLTSSDINTVVTVPDESTIILGGMLKLNQEKGGKKVPILGDLPLVGPAFRSVANSDVQSKLYVFVRAEIIRPAEVLAQTHDDLERISERDRAAFENHEAEFQGYQSWPGIKAKPMTPVKVLDAR